MVVFAVEPIGGNFMENNKIDIATLITEIEVPAISKHLANIFEEGELSVDSTVSKMEIVKSISCLS